MVLAASDELRDEVLRAMVKAQGNREEAARLMGKSLRTLNRYIHDLNLFAELDRLGLIRHAGPPRNEERGASRRKDIVLKYIRQTKGDVDYGELAVLVYGEDNDKTRQRLYTTMVEYKSKNLIAHDGLRWFVL